MGKEPFLKVDKCYGLVVKDVRFSDDTGISIKINNRIHPSLIGYNNGLMLYYGEYISDKEYNRILEEHKALETFGEMDTWD